MRLYAGTSKEFIRDTVHNQIAEKLRDSFFNHYRFKPSPGEVTSWRNSLRAVSQVFELGDLRDHGVLLEYQLPLTSKRLDCMICGEDGSGVQNAVIIELKQWDQCTDALGEHLVTTWVGGAQRELLHPSSQVGQYHQYLADTHTAFYGGANPVCLNACAYLHNYHAVADDVLYRSQFQPLLDQFPSFTADDVDSLANFLAKRLEGGKGMPVLEKVERSSYRPSKKLMEHVAEVIKGKPEYVLLDEQKVVFEKVLACAATGYGDRRKSVIIVHGGPGTGKSVIAINLLRKLLEDEKSSNYVTGSKAFTKTLHKILGKKSESLFKYFHQYGSAEPNVIDVLVCDEAHRIRKTSNTFRTPRRLRTDKAQIQELLDASKVAVFFIDDKQGIRHDEIGSPAYLREYAEKNRCDVFEYKLEAQFRCAGSDGFVNWVSNTLGIERTANILWDQGEEIFDFRIFDSPKAMDDAIRAKSEHGFSARMTAGFCWPWSNPNDDGSLIEDVVVGDYRRPWNARGDAGRLAPGIPKEVYWAHDSNGINQVGCIYTAQGFEFDYVGVIFGPDLTYDFENQSWKGNKKESCDQTVKRSGDQFMDLVKHTYRVLLSRGIKGCYVYFMDKDTERFISSRMEGSPRVYATDHRPVTRLKETYPGLGLRILQPDDVKSSENAVPIYSLKIAAGKFSESQTVDELGDHDWVVLPDSFRAQSGLFVSQAVGESMNRRIPNGSWCLFKLNPGGTRQGKVLVIQHRNIHDPDTGGHYTIKVYESEKEVDDDGGWKHHRITLKPDSTESRYKPIVFEATDDNELVVIAELVAVLC